MERSLLMQVHMDREGGWRAAEMLLQMERACRPTAVFCANDATAVGLVKELEKRGARVPQEVSVISIDDIPAAAVMDPGLTTMKIPVNEMGSIAVKVLRDRIKKGHVAYLNVFVPSRLIVRDSVAPLL